MSRAWEHMLHQGFFPSPQQLCSSHLCVSSAADPRTLSFKRALRKCALFSGRISDVVRRTACRRILSRNPRLPIDAATHRVKTTHFLRQFLAIVFFAVLASAICVQPPTPRHAKLPTNFLCLSSGTGSPLHMSRVIFIAQRKLHSPFATVFVISTLGSAKNPMQGPVLTRLCKYSTVPVGPIFSLFWGGHTLFHVCGCTGTAAFSRHGRPGIKIATFPPRLHLVHRSPR